MILINNKEIKITKFPNNESLIDTEYLNELRNRQTIEFKFESNEDILNLLFIADHLSEVTNRLPDLIITYMPYSRMDRSQNGSCFTLEYLVQILSCHFNNVYVIEPHSSVTSYLIENSCFECGITVSIIPELCSKILKEHPEIDTICFPDKGARQRYGDMDYFRQLGLNICYCDKIRDFDTGEILGLELQDKPDNMENVLILDDLCSKGGTFYYTAKKLKEYNAKNIYLGVCHMEKNVLDGEIIKKDSPIKHIYCTDSMVKDKKELKYYTVSPKGYHPIYGDIVDETNITCYTLNEFKSYNEIKGIK